MTTNPNSGGMDDPAVVSVAQHALSLVQEGAKVGLGSGRASSAFIQALGQRVAAGAARGWGAYLQRFAAAGSGTPHPPGALAEDLELDLIVDGADEVAPNLDLIKGWGGALVRERIVTSICRQQIILVGEEKMVEQLGRARPHSGRDHPLGSGLRHPQAQATGTHTQPASEQRQPPAFRLGQWQSDSGLRTGGAVECCGGQGTGERGPADRRCGGHGPVPGNSHAVLIGKADGSVKVLTKQAR